MRRRRPALALAAAALALALPALAASASAAGSFGVHDFDVTFTGPKGETLTQAGSHPYAMSTSFKVEVEEEEGGGVRLIEALKDIDTAQIEGLVGNPTAVPPCSSVDFLTKIALNGIFVGSCSDSSAVGTVAVEGVAAGKVG